MLSGKKILLGVSGSIAAYKACELASGLVKLGAEVQVIMTEGAREFVAPLTFQTLTGRPVTRGLFDEVKQWKVEHIGAAQWCDAFLVAPATANVIAKFVAGLREAEAIGARDEHGHVRKSGDPGESGEAEKAWRFVCRAGFRAFGLRRCGQG